jgi:hypothetical protein
MTKSNGNTTLESPTASLPIPAHRKKKHTAHAKQTAGVKSYTKDDAHVDGYMHKEKNTMHLHRILSCPQMNRKPKDHTGSHRIQHTKKPGPRELRRA